jgi:hypothetical protein
VGNLGEKFAFSSAKCGFSQFEPVVPDLWITKLGDYNDG